MRNLRSEEEIIRQWRGDLSKPLASISCLAYNHEKYIEDALEGFLIQKTDFPFEVLIHDDASTDRTAEIIREYEREYPILIKPIYQTENQWSKDRNAIREAQYGRVRGKYIAYCEGDDRWTDPLKLQIQVDYLENNPNSGFVHTGADTYIVQENIRIPWAANCSKKYFEQDAFINILTSDCIVRNLTVVARTELLRAIVGNNPQFFKTTKHVFFDLQKWLLMAQISSVGFINKSTGIRNMLPESLSQSSDLGRVVALAEQVYELQLGFWKEFNGRPEVGRKLRRKHYDAVLGVAFNFRNRELALKTVKEMRKNGDYPSPKQLLFISGSMMLPVNRVLRAARRLRRYPLIAISK